MEQLIQRLQRDLYAKESPGVIMCNLREKWLDKFLEKYDCNKDALTLGFLLADFKLQEAMNLRKPNDHMRMSIDYAEQVFGRFEVPDDIKKIVFEIIETHHGGEQKYIESKLFKNADCMGFLEPRGFLHVFGKYYTQHSEEKFNDAFNMAMNKADEKLQLVDLDEETIKEATMLYEKLVWIKERSGIK